MKKFLLATVCLALALSSCVKNELNEATENLINSQSQLILSEAELNKATAEATKLLAEAEAALITAQAEAQKVENAIREIYKQLAEVELEEAKAKLEVLLAELEAKKAQIAADVELAKVKAEQALIEAQEALANAKAQYLETLEGLEAYEAAKLATLYSKWSDAMEELIKAKGELTKANADVVAAENDLVDAEALLAENIAAAEKEIANLKLTIAHYEAYIAIASEYIEFTTEELIPILTEADIAAEAAYRALLVVEEETFAVQDELLALDFTTVPFFQLLNGGYDEDGNYIPSLAELAGLSIKVIDNLAWAGYYEYDATADALHPNGKDNFFPVYPLAYYEEYSQDPYGNDVFTEYVYNLYGENKSVAFKYENDMLANPMEMEWEYDQLATLGEIDVEALNAYIEVLKGYRDGELANLDMSYYNEIAMPALEALAKVAYEWKLAQEAYDMWAASVVVRGPMGGGMMPMPGGPATEPEYTVGEKVFIAEEELFYAKEAEAAAKAKSEEYNTEKTGLVAAADTELANAKKAEETAKKAYEDAKAAYEKDLTNEANKTAYEEAKAAYEEAQLDTQRAQYELDKIKGEAKAAADAYAAAQKATQAAEKALADAEAALFAEKQKEVEYLKALDAAQAAYNDVRAEWAEKGFEYYYDTDNGVEAYEFIYYDYYQPMAEEVEYMAEFMEFYAQQIENGYAVIGYLEGVVAALPELEANAEAFVAAYNEANTYFNEEAMVAYLNASLDYEIAEAFYYAVSDLFDGAEYAEMEIAEYEFYIDAANDMIADYERYIEQANTAEAADAVEFAKMRAEMAAKKVEVYQAQVDAAAAALKAAQEASAE